MNYLIHHGIKGQKWGVRRYQNKDGTLTAEGRKRYQTRHISRNEYQRKALSIHNNVVKYKNGGPAGNQNCMLCTICMECQSRGKNILPRPVYSPRDPVLQINGYEIVKNPEKISISNKKDIFEEIKNAGDGSRYYTHVTWKNSTGGHEFIIANIEGTPTLIDAQEGLVSDLNSTKASRYINGINYDKSFLVRMDNKDINYKVLDYNNHDRIVNWDWKKDIKYMSENDMLSDSDIKWAKEKGYIK